MNNSCLIVLLILLSFITLHAQEQSRESMAVDATAAQWSYQFAYEGKFNYRDDIMKNGIQRPEGSPGFFQFRWVAPIAKSESMPITVLPRLTMRAVQATDNSFGFGSSDIFALAILNQWATGRWGLGPQINFPASDVKYGNTNWGVGLAGAITQRELDDKIFIGLLMQQVWRTPNGGDNMEAAPLGINPIIVYQLGDGWYVGNGDFVISYNWNDGSFMVPFLVRVGKAFISPGTTWNTYVEYGTSVIYDQWIGSVPGSILRFNVQFQIPV